MMLNPFGWAQGCLSIRRETSPPQLFDHMVKTGDAYELACEIRQGST